MNQATKVLLIIILGSLVLLIGAGWLITRNQEQAGESQQQVVSEDLQDKLVRKDSHRVASESAQVTVVEFSDYQCPACRAAHPVVAQMIKEFSKDIIFVYRHFPLTQTHKNAMMAAQAAEAAGEQGKYWQMHNKLFEAQDEWASSGKVEEIFVGYAEELGLDGGKFNEAIKNGKIEAKIKRDQADGIALGVNATPTFFVNGKKAANFSLETLSRMVEVELAE